MTASDPLSLGPAPDLVPVDIRQDGPATIGIDWSDGHRSVFSFVGLRRGCPCATCKEEREQQARAAGTGRVTLPVLNLAQGPLKPREINPVGRYAYGIVWSDGHSTGIYRFDLLRALCECSACRPKP